MGLAISCSSRSCPSRQLVGLVGLEPTTPALSTRCSNQLSYRPRTRHPVGLVYRSRHDLTVFLTVLRFAKQPISVDTQLRAISRKEVIQPHLPIRLPCYDF